MSKPTLATVQVGDVLPEIAMTFTRADLVRYAGASGDFNIIHWNDRTANAVGLPGVIAHGMLTMGRAINVVTRWTQDPTSVVSYSVRFTRPVTVPDNDEGSVVTFTGKVAAINEDGTVKVDLSATFDGQTVIARSSATVKLA
jgi:acyl dehydratase